MYFYGGKIAQRLTALYALTILIQKQKQAFSFFFSFFFCCAEKYLIDGLRPRSVYLSQSFLIEFLYI